MKLQLTAGNSAMKSRKTTFWGANIIVFIIFQGVGYFILDKLVRKIIEESKRKTLSICDLLNTVEGKLGAIKFELEGGYQKFALIIDNFCSQGLLSPIKSSGIYPRNPPLASRYRINMRNVRGGLSVEEEENLTHELISLHPGIKKDYYLKNLEQYSKDREYILRLHNFLSDSDKCKSLKYRYTLNERSFEIFNDEKYLSQHGEVLLRRLGIGLDSLNCYKTYEAFFYITYDNTYGITHGKSGINNDGHDNGCFNYDKNAKKQYNALIIENKDTFMSIMKLLNRKQGFPIGGNKINLLIYGEGKKIISSFKFMEEITRDHTVDNIYYFGDIDYEGIGIFLNLKDAYPQYNIIPHVELYKQLVDKAELPPSLKTNQDEALTEEFLCYFDDLYREKISGILKKKKYIPQEALSFGREG